MQNATRMLLKNGFSQQHFIHLAFLMLKPSHRVLILTNFTLTKHLDRWFDAALLARIEAIDFLLFEYFYIKTYFIVALKVT